MLTFDILFVWLTGMRRWLWGPTSVFKVGDTVQLKRGSCLMVVVEVCSCRAMKQCLVHCEWYEPDYASTRRNLFPEGLLMHFDWHAAQGASR